MLRNRKDYIFFAQAPKHLQTYTLLFQRIKPIKPIKHMKHLKRFMVPAVGIGPTTFSLEGYCSSTELRGQIWEKARDTARERNVLTYYVHSLSSALSMANMEPIIGFEPMT